VNLDDEVGIFSVESEYRLDMGGACNDNPDHESWATILEVRALEGGGKIRYNQPIGLFCTGENEGKYRVDIGPNCCDTGHDSWATVFKLRKYGKKSDSDSSD